MWKLIKTKLRSHFEYYSIDNFNKYLDKVEDDLTNMFDVATVRGISKILRRRIK